MPTKFGKCVQLFCNWKNSLGKLPPINVAAQESLLLGYMPHRDDFEDFDKTVEGLVSQIGDKSVADEDVDVALKLGGLF